MFFSDISDSQPSSSSSSTYTSASPHSPPKSLFYYMPDLKNSPTPPMLLENNERQVVNGMQYCLICHQLAINKHFGALSCNACAAFFRRTVSQQKSYTCRRGKNCSIEKSKSKPMCRFCRFQRCVHAGMIISAVLVPIDKFENSDCCDSFLSRLVMAKRANFLNRSASTVNAYGGHEKMIRMADRHKDATSAAYAIHAETVVLNKFLYDVGIETTLKHADCYVPDVLKNIFYSWILCENIINTTKNAGFRKNQYYFVDESFVLANTDRLTQYYASNPLIRYPESIARHALDYFKTGIALAEKCQAAHFDEEERVALLFIFITSSAKRSFSLNNLFDAAFKKILCELKTHYEKNYDDVAIRMGNVILMLDEYQKFQRLFNEHLVLQRLNGKKSVFEELHDSDE